MTDSFVGVDVAKGEFVVACRPDGVRWTAPNDAEGIGATVARLRSLRPRLIVLEATGGYERVVVAALAAAGLPIVVANPRQVRDFAKATGRLAKTDDLDADVLALFADRVRPTPRPLADAVVQQLDALMTRRRQLLDMLTAERNRMEHAVGPIRRSLLDHLRWLERRVAALDRDLDDTIASSSVWRAKENLLRSVPGVGPVVSRTVLADVPELGHLNRKQIAALSGSRPLLVTVARSEVGGSSGVGVRPSGQCSTWGRSSRLVVIRSSARSTVVSWPLASRRRSRSSPVCASSSRSSTP